MSKVRAYSSARRMRPAFATGLPSSVIATAPASTISPISASRSPFIPSETIPVGYTRACPARIPSARTKPTAAGSSIGGSVFGIAHTAVKPPARAARAPLAIVSLCSPPGSRRCTCTSMKPGATTSPLTSITSASSGVPSPVPTASTRPSRRSTSAMPSWSVEGSTTCPPRSSSGRTSFVGILSDLPFRLCRLRPVGCTTGEEVEHRHSHGDTVRDLVQDDRVRAVRDVAVDLHPAVHRPGVEDQDVAWRALEPLARHTEHAVVLAQARDEPRVHALELKAQHVQRVRPLDRFLDPVEHVHAEIFDADGQQRARRAYRHLGAELGEAPDVGARNA